MSTCRTVTSWAVCWCPHPASVLTDLLGPVSTGGRRPLPRPRTPLAPRRPLSAHLPSPTPHSPIQVSAGADAQGHPHPRRRRRLGAGLICVSGESSHRPTLGLVRNAGSQAPSAAESQEPSSGKAKLLETRTPPIARGAGSGGAHLQGHLGWGWGPHLRGHPGWSQALRLV